MLMVGMVAILSSARLSVPRYVRHGAGVGGFETPALVQDLGGRLQLLLVLLAKLLLVVLVVDLAAAWLRAGFQTQVQALVAAVFSVVEAEEERYQPLAQITATLERRPGLAVAAAAHLTLAMLLAALAR